MKDPLSVAGIPVSAGGVQQGAVVAGGNSPLYLARNDVHELLGTFSRHDIVLDGETWPSVEHYYQAMKFENAEDRAAIRAVRHPRQARRLGRSRRRALRPDWHRRREAVMARAILAKCRAHPDVARRLLATGNRVLVESSSYDYFWGCGRDQRGANTFGRVLMAVRAHLLSGRAAAAD